VRPFWRFSRRDNHDSSRRGIFYGAGGQIFIWSTSRSFTLTDPTSPKAGLKLFHSCQRRSEKMDRGAWFRGGHFSKSARNGAPPFGSDGLSAILVQALVPPSTVRFAPVMYEDSGPARKATNAATSSTVP